MGCDVSSQTVRPDISYQSNLDNHALNARHAEKNLASSVGGDAQNNDTQSTHGLANDVSNMLSRPDNDNTGVAHEGNDNGTPSIESHLTDSTGLLYCDVASIINPQNMIAAIKRGDTDTVKALCNGTVGHAASGINSLGMWNSSPLMIATQYARVEIAHFLLGQAGIEIDHVNDKGVTTLLIACADGHVDLVARLLGMGAKIASRMAPGYFNLRTDKAINATPLSVAVMNGHYKCVDALVRYGVEVNTRFDFPLFNGTKTSSTLMTPIMLACMYGQSQMVNLLLAYNANCMLTDSSDSNVLHYALNEGPNAVAVFTILHNLLEEINLKQLVLAADKKGYTPLHNACISNHVDVIPILVSLGCNVDIRTRPPKVRENVLERTLRKSNNLGVEFKTSDFCKSIRMIDLTDKDDEVEVEVEGADVKGMKMLGDNSKSNGVSGEMKCDTSIPSLGALKSGQKTPSVAVETVLPSTLLLKPEDEVKKKKELENGTEKEVEKEGVEKGGVEKGVEKGVEIGVENGIEIEKGIDKGNDNVKNRRKSSFSSDGIAWGVTPLHIAVKRRSIAAVTSLLNAHADPCAKDDLGVSPLDMAKKLRADSPILLKLSKAAAEKQKIIVPMPMPISTPLHVSVRITEKILCLGIISEEGEELESTIISNIEVPKNVPKNVPENVPENVPMNAVAVCSERNRVIEEHILKTIQIATQNAIKKIVYSSQIA